MRGKKRLRKAQAKLADTERRILRDAQDERDVDTKPWYSQRTVGNAIRAATRH